MGAKATPKKRRKATIVPFRFCSKGQSRSKCCFLCRSNFLVHHPRNAVPAEGRYCVQAAMKSRCASRISLLFAPGEAAEEFVFTKRRSLGS